jgi:mono/diheme cytochrome c family protein
MKSIGAIGTVLLLVTPAFASPDAKALYQKKCGICHGNDGVAKKTAAGSKNFNDPDYKKTATVESIVKAAFEGAGTMKPVVLSPDDSKAIANYILSLPAAK